MRAPGNLTDLALSENQTRLVEALSQTGKPLVLILNEGRPRIIHRIEPLASAIVDIILPGNYGADALASLLAGDSNFSGKLPFTYPKYINSLATYDYKPCENIGQTCGNYNGEDVMDILWAFGHGLSYTTFRYSNFKTDHPVFRPDNTLTFHIDVTNTGDREGKESILLFSNDLVANITPDNRRLREFTKISLVPGETRTVTFRLNANDLAFVGYDCKWRLEKGTFTMRCGNQTLDIYCTETKIWKNPDKD